MLSLLLKLHLSKFLYYYCADSYQERNLINLRIELFKHFDDTYDTRDKYDIVMMPYTYRYIIHFATAKGCCMDRWSLQGASAELRAALSRQNPRPSFAVLCYGSSLDRRNLCWATLVLAEMQLVVTIKIYLARLIRIECMLERSGRFAPLITYILLYWKRYRGANRVE